ncbi:MAG: hypothetical protein ACRDXC_06410 [Acidimicrobiales bacterium]
MRTRIALDAARDLFALVRPITKKRARLLRRAAGSGLVCLGLLAGAVLSPTTAMANHRFDVTHDRHVVSITLPRRLSLTPMATRWLSAWDAPHVEARFEGDAAAPTLSWADPSWAPTDPTPPPAPPPPVTDSTSTTTPDWACIRQYESGDQYNSPTVPGGAYGFLEMTWLSLGYSGWPYQASPWVQSRAALFLHNELGWQPWGTRFVCGL